jgi:chitosanase
MRRLLPLLALLGLVVLAAGNACGRGSGDGELVVSAEQQGRIDAVVSVFENGSTEVQYGYVEDLDDGRGFTAGRAGFTSATGDLLDVVERHAATEPDGELAGYLPELERLAEAQSDDVSGLEGFPEAWTAAAEQPDLRRAQDEVVAETYLEPALAWADDLGMRSAVGALVLFDTIVQHGEGDDPDGLPALVAETALQQGETPADGADETEWLLVFLEVRDEHLLDAADPDTREEWAESADRTEALATLVEHGPVDLDEPFTVQVFGDTYEVP